ncbi:hypothetical protein LINPERHAP1_LOCUS31097 [Linum perenne]
MNETVVEPNKLLAIDTVLVPWSHSEISIAFAEEKKIPELLKTFPNATQYLKTVVSFGKVTPEQKQEMEKFGLSVYSWEEIISTLETMMEELLL